MLSKYLKKLSDKGEVYLKVKVKPGAGADSIVEAMDDGTIKLNIAAEADKNKANRELIIFLAKQFGVSKNSVKIISGQKYSHKLIKIIKE